ncbi:hypothetical protein Pmani_016452 [Petrolisthes manimaculis]|uniref:Uncharacterized protein n=1 Tax=Petrolisthes manimaculis TaxID=1843537 RepID=A0AAE1PQ28_9EUCA|nr:hypothetical protein Pmani_016452 [Petrolisthes manimaculis]
MDRFSSCSDKYFMFEEYSRLFPVKEKEEPLDPQPTQQDSTASDSTTQYENEHMAHEKKFECSECLKWFSSKGKEISTLTWWYTHTHPSHLRTLDTHIQDTLDTLIRDIQHTLDIQLLHILDIQLLLHTLDFQFHLLILDTPTTRLTLYTHTQLTKDK